MRNLTRPTAKRSLIFAGLFLLTFSLLASANQIFGANQVELAYEVDRSAVPTLNEYDLTYSVDVGDGTNIMVLDDQDQPITHWQDLNSTTITFTTNVTSFHVTVDDVSNPAAIGSISKLSLKDGYLWAYSHGFDDNFWLDSQRQVFLDRNLPATYNLVSEFITETDDGPGSFDISEFQEIMDAGWSINNHSTTHEEGCSVFLTQAERRADVLAAQASLNDLIDRSSRPDYNVIGFSIPCGGDIQYEHYPPAVFDIRDNNEATLLYVEGGLDTWPPIMDVTSPIDPNALVVRDGRIDGENGYAEGIIEIFDDLHWRATSELFEVNLPYWYTTFSHGSDLFGDNTAALEQTLDYLVATYGTGGTDEVWIAPTDVVYSYLILRDTATVSRVNSPTPSPTPTEIPIETPVETPTETPITPEPSPTTIPSPTPTVSPVACNEFDNPDFENGLSDWQPFGTLEIVPGRTDNGLAVTNGYASQSISVSQLDGFTFKGYTAINQLDPQSWTGVGVDYLDSAGEEIGEVALQIIPTTANAFDEFEITGTPPEGTASIEVWLFSASTQAQFIIDDLTFEWDTCEVSTPTPEPTPTEEPPIEPTMTPTPSVEETATPVSTETPAATPTPDSTEEPQSGGSNFIYLPILVR